VCVECLIGKQKKPILFKVTEPSSIPYRTPPACAKMAAYSSRWCSPLLPLPVACLGCLPCCESWETSSKGNKQQGKQAAMLICSGCNAHLQRSLKRINPPAGLNFRISATPPGLNFRI